MSYEYISWNHFSRLCNVLYRRIAASDFTPETIVAVARGGYSVGRVLADYFGVMDLASVKIEHYRGPDKMPHATVRYPLPTDVDGRRVLLVDDVSDSGDTFIVALQHLRQHGEPALLRTAVLHHKQTSRCVPDYHAQRVLKWRWITYPWAVVEDLTALAAQRDPPPRSIEELGGFLVTEVGMTLPAGTFRQVAPVVLQRLENTPAI